MGCDTSKDVNPNAARGYVLEKFTRHKGGINCMAMDEDRTLMVTGGEDRTLRLWRVNATPTHCKATFEGHAGYVNCAVFHNKFLLSGSADNMIRKWCLSTYKCLYIYEGHTGRINRLVCAGDLLLSTSVDHTARVWTLVTPGGIKSKEVIIKVLEGHARPVYPLVFYPTDDSPLDGKTINDRDIVITGSADRTARIWSLRTGTAIHILKGHTGTINALVVDPEGKLLFTGGGDGLICSWNIQTGECVKKLKGHDAAVLTLMGHNKMLYSGSVDQTARAWIMDFGECIKVYRGHTHSITSLAYEDGYLFTGSGDSTAKLFKARTGECLRTFKGHKRAIIQLQALFDKLYTVSADGTLRVWDTTGILEEESEGDNTEDTQLQRVEAFTPENHVKEKN